MITSSRHLSAGELAPLADLLALVGLTKHFSGDAVLRGSDPVIRSPHRLGEASATAQLLIGAAGAAIWEARGGGRTDISMDILHALHHLHPTHYVEQAGYSNSVGAEFVAVNGVFETRDRRYVMLEAGPPYEKLLTGYLNFFDCGNNKESFAREVAKWEAEDVEEALTKAGLPVCRAFTREEWLAHPQGRMLAPTPPIEIVKIADGDPVPFRACGNSPLDGVRVLDFTHVLAGPRSARTLAEYGAEVLHISSPWYADTLAQHLGVDVGKYDAFLDLRFERDTATMRQLAATADVFASTYRPAVNARFGLLPEPLAAASERGIVYMSANGPRVRPRLRPGQRLPADRRRARPRRPDHDRDHQDQPPDRHPTSDQPGTDPRLPHRVPGRCRVRATRDHRRRFDRHPPRQAQPASAASATPRTPNLRNARPAPER